MPGMDRHRVDVLGPGALVIARLLRHLGLDGVTVSDWGLREGVILEALGLSTVDVSAPPCRRSWARRAEQVVA